MWKSVSPLYRDRGGGCIFRSGARLGGRRSQGGGEVEDMRAGPPSRKHQLLGPAHG